MHIKTRLKLLPFVLLVTSSLFGQAQPNISDFTKVIEVLPPSPNAASLGKYGGIDVGLSSGAPNVSVPIYGYKSNNIELPISLSYSGNGLRVDEIASRVGTGWNLNAGGVITRTVFGAIDEESQRSVPPSNTGSRAYVDFMDNLSSLGAYGPYDGQPDLFNFNVGGYSGRFILDSNLTPSLLSYSSVKIEKDFNSTLWNFKITTPDGVQYLFGGTGATETTNKNTSGNGCGKSYPNFAPTAWYLNKIAHPNNDTLTFTYSSVGMHYKTGISQTIYSPVYNVLGFSDPSYGCTCFDLTSPSLDNTTCATWLQTNGALLQEINSTGGAKIKFIYVTRSDFDDRLLSKIEIYQPNQSTIYKSFEFNYIQSYATGYSNPFTNADASLNYRPFLSSMTEKSADASLTKTYNFLYNDINARPPRLSYAQDHYGFFNGKNNSTLIPRPASLMWQQNLPSATADRETDPVYCAKGMLSKIIYPTG
ncbi:MAG TPA: hypothetical protein VFU29_15885, partial [Chitinophagaceae bacterium]|nr:hypothetical protein [Chitinophagaceae bacterium]